MTPMASYSSLRRRRRRHHDLLFIFSSRSRIVYNVSCLSSLYLHTHRVYIVVQYTVTRYIYIYIYSDVLHKYTCIPIPTCARICRRRVPNDGTDRRRLEIRTRKETRKNKKKKNPENISG